jgi:hypothetical protein
MTKKNINLGNNVVTNKQLLTVDKLRFWYDKKWNVLLKGHAGCGKTSLILQAWEKCGLTKDEYLYFSASTMDPFVDLIGVPKEKVDSNGKSYLDLIRPKNLYEGNIKAIFFDEYNRANKKVRNAVMELIQFKSINGNKFPNLQVVWAAINPKNENEDEPSYDVDEIDPAQLDRFQIQFDMPYEPYKSYFVGKYGKEKALAAINWWNGLSNELRQKVSPRRLDYCIEIHNEGGDLCDVLPPETGISKLKSALGSTPILIEFESIFNQKDKVKAVEFIQDENKYNYMENEILNNDNYIKFWVPLFDKEKISKLINDKSNIKKFCLNNYLYDKNIENILLEIKSSNLNNKISKEIENRFIEDKKIVSLSVDKVICVNDFCDKEMYIDPNSKTDKWKDKLESMYDSKIENISNLKKIGCIEVLYKNAPTNISMLEANKCLTILNKIVDQIKFPTLMDQFPQLIALINQCFCVLKIDYKEASVEFPFIINSLLIRDDFYYIIKDRISESKEEIENEKRKKKEGKYTPDFNEIEDDDFEDLLKDFK